MPEKITDKVVTNILDDMSYILDKSRHTKVRGEIIEDKNN